MPCELDVEIIGEDQAAQPALELIANESGEPTEEAGSAEGGGERRRRFNFPSAGDCDSLRETLSALLDERAPGWRQAVRF